jgi:membrane protein
LKAAAPGRELVDLAFQALARFIGIEGTQQATILGAQAFTSMIPFVVVASAIAPGGSDIADSIIDRFGLDGRSADSVRSLFASAGETESAVTWVSIFILILATLSFTRALQRVFQRAYGQEPGGLSDVRRGLGWLAAFAGWVTISSPLRGALEDVGGVVFAVALATVTGFFLWLWTPMILLRGQNWRRLAPGAAVSGLLGALLGVASSIYVPLVMTWSADRYGLIGIAFAIQSWLLVLAFVVVIGAVVGAVVVDRFGDLNVRRLRERAR